MADDNDDWFGGGDDTPADAPAAAGAGGDDTAVDAGVVGAEEADEIDEGPDEDDLPTIKRRTNKDLDRPIIFKVWKRPVFLQYSYLYDYRHNYYDDVIDYLDRRQRGISRDIPRPQTWAERALRTYCSKVRQSAAYESRTKDISLLSDMRTSARFYNYHSKEYMCTKYSKYL